MSGELESPGDRDQGFPILPSSGSAEGGSPLPGCGVSPQKPFFFSFARRLRRRAKEGRKLGTPQTPAGRPLHPFERRTGKPCDRDVDLFATPSLTEARQLCTI
ncbi:hypothetical protein [Reticulibacter mediterranei]|uniref:hypothetical protein n=1 Tax=Reticulibacter mediterranei TaxID=2778369 RepID=UPI001C6919D1|nr:hypothetical protein [Reticulibacter mediterranei]